MNKDLIYDTLDCMRGIKKKNIRGYLNLSYGEFFLQKNVTCIKLILLIGNLI